MPDEEIKKRAAGQKVPAGEWLVLIESIYHGSDGFVHRCGQGILYATVAHPLESGSATHFQDVPYCPKCEDKPISTAIPC